MPEEKPFSSPVENSVPKVDDAVAVDENLEFQERWWRFERATWIFFSILILLDILGVFGRGYFAKAERHTSDGAIDLNYERIERASTPSIMTYRFGPGAVRDGQIQLFVSESVVKTLGAQRISPQPIRSSLDKDGITYTFPASTEGGMVEIALEPSFPGVHTFTTGLAGEAPVQARVVVVP